MRKVLVLAALCGACGSSQPRPETADETRDREHREALLEQERVFREWQPPVMMWQVGEGEDASVIFAVPPYGTTLRHALPAPHDHRLETARALVTEADPRVFSIEETSEPALMNRRDRLDRILGRETWALLRAQIGPQPGDDLMRRFQPLVVIDHIARIRMAEVEAASDGREPVPFAASTSNAGHELHSFAASHGVSIVQLETNEQIFAASAAFPREPALEELRFVLEQADSVRNAMGEAHASYLSADDEILVQTCTDMAGAPAAYVQAVQAADRARVEGWMPAIGEQLTQGRAFIAIAVCRVLGPEGVLARLGAQGATIHRLGAPPGSTAPPDPATQRGHAPAAQTGGSQTGPETVEHAPPPVIDQSRSADED